MSGATGNKQLRRYFDPKLLRSSPYSDGAIDAIVASAERQLERIATQELALRNVGDLSDIIVVRYPNLAITPVVARDDIHVHLGLDGAFRFSSYSFHLIFVTQNHLSTYTATWNAITNEIGEGDWEEWPYRHIVSVNAGALEEELPALDRKARKRKKKHGPEMAVVGYYFAVRNAGGGTLYASIEDKPIRRFLDDKLAKDANIEKRQEAMMPIADHFKSCQNRLRDKIREREQALSGGVESGRDPTTFPPQDKPMDSPSRFPAEEDD